VRVGNKSQHWARALMDVELAPDTDIDHAEHVIHRVAGELHGEREDILEEPEVRGIEQRDDGTLVFRLLVKTLPADRDAVGAELRRRLAEAFASEGIEAAGAQAVIEPEPAVSAEAAEAQMRVEARGNGDAKGGAAAKPPRRG
jgi:moderate conductance mechanosensitive channel